MYLLQILILWYLKWVHYSVKIGPGFDMSKLWHPLFVGSFLLTINYTESEFVQTPYFCVILWMSFGCLLISLLFNFCNIYSLSIIVNVEIKTKQVGWGLWHEELFKNVVQENQKVCVVLLWSVHKNISIFFNPSSAQKSSATKLSFLQNIFTSRDLKSM